MTPNIFQEVVNTVRDLNERQQREVLEYAKKISENKMEKVEKPEKKKIWEQIEEIMQTLPKDAFEDYPTDGSLNHDHYLYGAPKREHQ